MNRIYGKPEPALVATVPPNPAVEVIRSLSSTRSSSSSGDCNQARSPRHRRYRSSTSFRRPVTPPPRTRSAFGVPGSE